MRPSPELAGKIERAHTVVNTFLQARTRMADPEAVERAVRRYPGLDPEGRTPRGGVRRDYAPTLLRDLLTDLAHWEDVHGLGGQEMLVDLHARWKQIPFGESDGPARHIAAELVYFANDHSASLRDAAEQALRPYSEEWQDTEGYWKVQAAQGAVPGTIGLGYSVLDAPMPVDTRLADPLFRPTAVAALGALLTHDRPGRPTQVVQLRADGSPRLIDHAALWQDVLEETGPPGEWLYTRAAWFDQAHMTWKEAAHRVDATYPGGVSPNMREESSHSPVMLFRLVAALHARDVFEDRHKEEEERTPAQALDEALQTFLSQTGLPYAPDDPETAAALLTNLALILDTQGLPGRLLLQPADAAAPTWPQQIGDAGRMAALLEERFRGTDVSFSAVLQQAQATYDTHWRSEHAYRSEQIRNGTSGPSSPVRYLLSSPASASTPAFEQACPNAAVAWLEFLQRDTPLRPVEVTAELADGRSVTADLTALAWDAHRELDHEDAWNEGDGPMAQDLEQRTGQAQTTWLRQQLINVSTRPDRAAPRRERIVAVFGSAGNAHAFLRDQAGQATPSASAREEAALRRSESALTRLFANAPDAGRVNRLRDAAQAVIAESAARHKDLTTRPSQASPSPAAAEQIQHHHLGGQTPGTAAPRR